jgi:HSP20 family protein
LFTRESTISSAVAAVGIDPPLTTALPPQRQGLTMSNKFSRVPSIFDGAMLRSGEAFWCPAADIYRTRTGWLIKYDLAGVGSEDIEVTVLGAQITVRGMRRDWQLEDGARHYSMEIAYNRFERTLELPCDVSGAAVEIRGREGILLLRLTCQGDMP